METSAQKHRLDRTSMELLGNIQSAMMTRHQKAEVMIAGEQLRYAILKKLVPGGHSYNAHHFSKLY